MRLTRFYLLVLQLIAQCSSGCVFSFITNLETVSVCILVQVLRPSILLQQALDTLYTQNQLWYSSCRGFKAKANCILQNLLSRLGIYPLQNRGMARGPG
jgi:hypothetical protein